MSKILSFTLFCFFLVVGNCYSQEKIVFIDINYIFKNSNVGKDLNDQIVKKDKELKLEASKFRSVIDEERKKILSQKNVLSADEYNKKVKILEEKINAKNSELTLKNKELNSIIEEYSLKNSINLILNKENLLMAKKNLDITQQVFSIFNEKVKEINLN